ncbi:hypothetical protein RFI_17199, partial [Reticulomyxa filosa]
KKKKKTVWDTVRKTGVEVIKILSENEAVVLGYWLDIRDKINDSQQVIVVNQSDERICISLASIEKVIVEMKAIVEWQQSVTSDNDGNNDEFIHAIDKMLEEGNVLKHEVDRVIFAGDCCSYACNPYLVTLIEASLQKPGVCATHIPFGGEKEENEEESVQGEDLTMQGAVVYAMSLGTSEQKIGSLIYLN